MNKLKLSPKKIIIACIFVIFFMIIMAQLKLVYLGFDDFGYASLSYAHPLENFSGHNYNLIDALRYLYGHYLYWGGRVLYFGFELLFLRFGINYFRLMQTIITFFIAYISYCIVKKTNNRLSIISAILCCLFYFLMQIDVNGDGTYWFTASVLYLWPILPVIIGMFLIYELINNRKNWSNKKLFVLFVCSFLATFSQEQIAFSYILMLVLSLSVFTFEHKKIEKHLVINLLVALIGFGLLYLAPGNFARQVGDAFYELSFLDKLGVGIPRLLESFFSKSTYLFQVLLYVTCFIANIKMIKEKKGDLSINFICVFGSLLIAAIVIFHPNSYNWIARVSNANIIYVNIFFIIILIIMVIDIGNICLYLIKSNLLFTLSIGAIFSMAPMVYSPYYVNRAAIPLILMLIPFIVSTIINILIVKNYLSCFIGALSLLIGVACCVNEVTQFNGYKENSYYRNLSDIVLTETSKKIKEGQKVSTIEIYKNYNHRYTGLMPYHCGDGQSGVENQMKKYYDLPIDIEFVWLTTGEE